MQIFSLYKDSRVRAVKTRQPKRSEYAVQTYSQFRFAIQQTSFLNEIYQPRILGKWL